MEHKKFSHLFPTFLSFFKYVHLTIRSTYQHSTLKTSCRFIGSFSHRIVYLTKDNTEAVCLPDFGLFRGRVMWSLRRGICKTRQDSQLLVDEDKQQHPLPHTHMQLHQSQMMALIFRLTFSDTPQHHHSLSPTAFQWDLSSNTVCLFEKRTSEPGGIDSEFILLQNNHESAAKVSHSSCCHCINAGCMRKTVKEQSLSSYQSLQTYYFFIHKSLGSWDWIESFSLVFNHIFCFHCFQSHTSRWCLQYTFLSIPILITFSLLPLHFGKEYSRHCLQKWSANTAEN